MKPVPKISLSEAVTAAKRSLVHDELIDTLGWRKIVKAMLPAAEHRLLMLERIRGFERELNEEVNGE